MRPPHLLLLLPQALHNIASHLLAQPVPIMHEVGVRVTHAVRQLSRAALFFGGHRPDLGDEGSLARIRVLVMLVTLLLLHLLTAHHFTLLKAYHCAVSHDVVLLFLLVVVIVICERFEII